MLLLVDDEEPQIGEPNVLGEQRVRPDNDVEPPVGELLLDRARLFGGAGRDSCAMRSSSPAKR